MFDIDRYAPKKKNEVNFPTAEKYNIGISLYIHNILCQFFPNSFKNEKDAYDFLIAFCEKANALNENKNIYKQIELYNICLDINVDLLSGLKIVNNHYYNNSSLATSFTFFEPDNIKNENLKNEIKNLYKENFDFLESIGFLHKWSNGNLGPLKMRIEATPWGIDYLLPYWADYSQIEAHIRQNKLNYGLPTLEVINLLRVTEAYHFSDEKCKQIEQDFKQKLEYKLTNFEINWQEKSVKLANKFITVNLKVDYCYPASLLTTPYGNIRYYNIFHSSDSISSY